MFNLSKHAQGELDGAVQGLSSGIGEAAELVNPTETSELTTDDVTQGLTPEEEGAVLDSAEQQSWNRVMAQIGQMSPEIKGALERTPDYQQWAQKINNSNGLDKALENMNLSGADLAVGQSLDIVNLEKNILSRANALEKLIAEQQGMQSLHQQTAFNLKQHKIAQMSMPEQLMPQESIGRFPVENEGDFISKFADDLLANNNEPGTQEYERARIAVEEIRDAISPGFEEEANSIIESITQLDVQQRDIASEYLIKLYEVLIPPMLKNDQSDQGNPESQMEPVMSKKNQDAIEGLVRYSLTDNVLNNKNIKTAADQFGQQYLLYGPTEKRICPKLRGKNMSVGDVVSEYTCRHHCIDGIVIDDNKTVCGEALWRANSMDKYSREYVNAEGEIEGGYLNKRFETNRNVPEENKMRLKPGETRKPRPAAWGNTESRLQDMRSKEGQTRNYRPETNIGDPFEWCHDVDQNNVEINQTERNSREEASGQKLVQYTNRDQGENNPKKAFNLKQFKTAQTPVAYSPRDDHQIAVNPTAAGVRWPDVKSTKVQGKDGGKPLKKKDSKNKKAGFNLNQFKKAETPHPITTALPEIEFKNQHQPGDKYTPYIKPTKKKS